MHFTYIFVALPPATLPLPTPPPPPSPETKFLPSFNIRTLARTRNTQTAAPITALDADLQQRTFSNEYPSAAGNTTIAAAAAAANTAHRPPQKGWWGGAAWAPAAAAASAYLVICRRGGTLEVFSCIGRGTDARARKVFRAEGAALAPATLWNEMVSPGEETGTGAGEGDEGEVFWLVVSW